MLAQPYAIDIPVPIIQYGYFLYVWEVTIAEDKPHPLRRSHRRRRLRHGQSARSAHRPAP